MWGGRGRRRFRHHLSCRCVRKQCRSLVRFPQVSHCRYKPNTSLSHTSNSGPVAPIIISCCRCCWPQRAERCTARPDLLELVEDADLFRGRFAAGCCALKARRSWLVGILWFEGKSGHLERVEMVGSIREVLGWLLATQLDCRKMVETGKSKGSCRLLALPSKNRNTPCGPPCYAMPCQASPLLTPSP